MNASAQVCSAEELLARKRERLLAVARIVADTPVEEGGTKGRRVPAHWRPAEAPKDRRFRPSIRHWKLTTGVAFGAALLASGLAFRALT